MSETALGQGIKSIGPGDKMPDYVFMNESRGNTHLRSIKAKYKLLYFWVSRCDSCFKDMELLKEQYNRI